MKTDRARIDILRQIQARQLSPEQGLRLMRSSNRKGIAHKPLHPEPIPGTDHRTPAAEAIAVIGMAGRFPGAQNLNQFWKNLAAGLDSVHEIPKDRWDMDRLHDTAASGAPGKTLSPYAGCLSDVDRFDPLFFSMSPREAELTDPQHRLFLEESWHALEDAGYAPKDLAGSRCGVYVGYNSVDYRNTLRKAGIPVDNFSFLGNLASLLPARIAYCLNLKGPSIAVNTACSSSLVAVHLACESIRSGTVDTALAGGVQVLTTEAFHLAGTRSGMLSPTGRCRTFDDRADGFVPGEGVGVVMLKPFNRAVADGDPIYAVIRAGGINQDGRSNGITAPSATSQTALASEIYHRYDISPESIGYVEAHGTATVLGDPIEVQALTDAFRHHTRRKGFCAIGSVKTNIGHTLAAAGIAGFIKAVLCLKHRELVPSLHYQKANAHIDFESSPFFVNTESRPWEHASAAPRRAAVSAFGLSGTNAHLVLEEYPEPEPTDGHSPSTVEPQVVVLSAKTEDRLKAYADSLVKYLEGGKRRSEIENMAFTLQTGRDAMEERLAAVVSDAHALVEKLTRFVSGEMDISGLYASRASGNGRRSRMPDLLEGRSGRAFMDTLMEDREWHKLAQLWVMGAEVDWKRLPRDPVPRRIPLPAYPFAKERCWATPVGRKADDRREAGHPLLGRVDPKRSLSHGVVFKKRLTAADPILRDHVVAHQPILPGVGYLEMAVAAGKTVVSEDALTLNQVVWRRPVTVTGDAREIFIVLREHGKNYDFRIESRSGDAPSVHVTGEIMPIPRPSAIQAPVSVPEIAGRCPEEVDADTLYRRFDETGIRYGAYFRGVHHIRRNRNEALGHLVLPEALKGEHHRYTLHPAMADAALQTIFALTGDAASMPMLPFSVEAVAIYRPLPAEAYAHVRRIHENRYQVSVLDTNGSVCLTCRDFSVRPLPDPLRHFFFVPRWAVLKPEAADPGPIPDAPADISKQRSEKESILLLYPPNRLGLEKSLAACHREDRIYRIRLGDRHRQSGRTWEVDVSDASGLERCIDRIGPLHRIYFLGGIEAASAGFDDPAKLDQSQDRGVVSLLRLIQALVHHDRIRHKPRLIIVTNDVYPVVSDDRVRPFAGSIPGLSRVIAKEYPELRVACFDVRLNGIAAGRPSEEIRHLADRIFRESRNPRNPEATAIRKGIAYERRIEPVSLEPAGGVPFRENGVYLIVGGAGGIGSALGRYLAERVRARLVLVGRRPVHTRVAQVLETIRTHGGEGHYLRADITDEAGSVRMVQEALSRYGHINGVFHSALLLMDRTVGNLTEADFKTVLSPKGIGTLNLFRALEPVHPDFMMVFSSAQSFICNPGQASYAAASTLQDALVAFLQQEAAYPIHLVNWGYWGSVGIVSNDATRKRMREQGVGSIEPGEGMEAVRRILSRGPAQALCIKAENRFLERLGITRETGDHGAPLISPSRPESTAPASSMGFDEPVPEKNGPDHGIPVSEESLGETALDFLKGIFSKTLKMDKDRLDPHATFENYGIDSLVVLEINRDLEKVFGRLRATLLFEHKTLAVLTDYFMANHRTELTRLFRSSKAPDIVGPMTGASAYPNDTRPAMGRASERLERVRSDGDSRIAVVGLSGRYPMAESLDAFWRNLMTGRRCIREIPGDRWDWKSLHGPETGIYSRWGGFMDGVDRFDPLFFNISPREAKTMDPQERLFLQTAHAAFEDAGYSRRRLERGNHRVGVFVGVMNCNYEWLGGNAVARGHSTTAGSAYWSVANRVSYFFDLTGPSLAVDTACSASLTAVHLACDSIRDGSCDMALAGGVNLILHPMHFQRLCQMNMLASDEFCRCFGDAADGFVDGEGVGALVLKPLDRALQDRDPIYGIILASAINAGGKTSGYSVPNPNAQADLIEATLRKAGVAPETISYVEAHGTGTELGDPIEITGLTQAFERFSRSRTQGRCAVGSVKSNIGHLESAAGIAGITKVLLQMRHGRLAPTINAEVLNPHIPFEDTPFYLQREASDWKRPVIQTPEGETIVPRRAGISSFGAGGANAHLILEEFREPAVAVDRSPLTDEPQIIVLSAKNEDRLKAYAERMVEFLEIHHSGFENPNPNLADIAYTLQTGRDALEERLALVAGSRDDLRDTLFRYVNGGQDVEDLFTGHVSRKGAPSSVRKADSIDADFLNRLLIQRELRKIAMLWVSGYEIDWERLHPDPPPVRISLPSYPFAGERYWIPVDAAPAAPSTDAPAEYLIDGIDTKTSLDGTGISFRKRLKRSHDMVTGHQLQEQAVLSGSVVLSMVHEAASLALDRIPFRLTRGTWLKPLSLTPSDPEKDAFVSIRPRGEHYRYKVRTRHGKGWVTHASGEIERVEPAGPIPQVDVESIQSVCRSLFERESVYERFGSLGLRYGPYFRVLDTIWVGEKQALARFALSRQREGKAANDSLEPAVLDGAFQTLAGFALVRPQGDPAPLMPFAFEAFQIHHPLPKAGYILARRLEADRYDLAVLDDTGTVCSTISSVTLKKEANGLHRMFFKPVWRPCDTETVAESPRTTAPQKVLLVRIGDRGDATIAASLGRLHAGDTVHTLWIDGPDRGYPDGYRSLNSADPEAFQLGLSDIESPDVIYYLAGLPEVASDPTDFSGLATARNRLLILFRLMRSLSRSGKLGGQRPVALNIVTCDLQDVPGRVSKQPLAGGLIGFARSLANEVPGLGVRCIDCSSDVTAETVGPDPYDAWLRPVISREIEPGPVRETALSGGSWYERMLEPIRLPSVGETPFRQGGVYLILGGSGRIGLVLSRYLAQTVGARLMWVGRSPWNDTLRKKRDLIRSLGGEARYMAADASDPEALATAVQEARARFGKIDGAFHCAVSEAPGLVDDLTEESFAAGLAPKLAGSLAFHQAIGPEPVDFLIFFSSSQSFIGDRGLSAYAAGCAATDALAGYLDRRMPYPVLSIDWGVWETEPGLEADAFHSRTRALGFKPIAPEEAMEALARILVRPLHQILVLKAAERLLQRIGVSDSHRIERYPVQMPSLMPHTTDRITPPEMGRSKIRQLGEAFSQLQQFGRFLLLDAFQRMGIFGNRGETYQVSALRDRMNLEPGYQRLLEALIRVAEKSGFVRRIDGTLTTTPLVDDARTKSKTASLEESRDQLAEAHPDVAPHAKLLWNCLSAYPEVLSGAAAAVDILFPHASTERVDALYKGNAAADHYNRMAATAAETLVADRLACGASDHPLRILEIGAGTGGTSQAVLEAISDFKDRVTYDYTDISLRFLQHGRERFGHHSFVRFEVLDIEGDPVAQGYPPAHFDLVIAANVLHATRSIRRTISHAKRLLKTNGWLLLNEVTGPFEFATLTFGLMEGWWRYEDGADRLPGGPLIGVSDWQRLLAEEGFDATAVLGEPRIPVSQHIFIAQSNGEVRYPIPSADIGRAQAGSDARPHAPAAPDADPAAMKRKEAWVEHQVKAVMARVLEIDPKELDPDAPHSDFGVDSILAVEIIDRLSELPHIRLQSTDLFNYPTIRRLTRHILEHYGGDRIGPDGVDPADRPAERTTASDPRAPEDPVGAGAAGREEDHLLMTIIEELRDGRLDIDEAHARLSD